MDVFAMYTFESRQALAAATAKYDAARSYLDLVSNEPNLYNEEDIWQAQKRVEKAERKLEDLTRALIQDVDNFLEMMGEDLQGFLYGNPNPVHDAA